MTSVAFDYDEAAIVTATLTGLDGGIPANAAPITLSNTGLVPAGFKTLSGVGTVERDDPGPIATVVAVHAADNGCGSGETLTLTTFSGDAGTQRVALPYGTWSIQVANETAHGAWETVVMDPGTRAVVDVEVRIR